jgi:hypothetical protein
LRRRLNEQYLLKRLTDCGTTSHISRADASVYLNRWSAELNPSGDTENDRDMALWLEHDGKKIRQNIETLKSQLAVEEVVQTAVSNKAALMDGFAKVVNVLSEQDKKALIDLLGK